MYPTKCALVYFSPTGGTRAVLNAIAEGFDLACVHVDMTLPAQRVLDCELDADTLLVLGFPVYYGRVPLIQKDILPRLQGQVRYALPVVVYGNRAYEDSLRELGELCRQKGYELAAAAAFVAEHSYSAEMGTKRPDDADRALARTFGAAAMRSLQAGKTLDCAVLPGTLPYKTYGPKPPIVPDKKEGCTACGECARLCPTGAISGDGRTIDGQRCILCAACVKRCPYGAWSLSFAPMQERIRAMAAANLEPKQPQLFLPE